MCVCVCVCVCVCEGGGGGGGCSHACHVTHSKPQYHCITDIGLCLY